MHINLTRHELPELPDFHSFGKNKANRSPSMNIDTTGALFLLNVKRAPVMSMFIVRIPLHRG